MFCCCECIKGGVDTMGNPPMGPMGIPAAIWAAWAIKAGLAMAPCMAGADVTVDDAHGLGMGMAICWLLGRLDPLGLPPAAWAIACCNA